MEENERLAVHRVNHNGAGELSNFRPEIVINSLPRKSDTSKVRGEWTMLWSRPKRGRLQQRHILKKPISDDDTGKLLTCRRYGPSVEALTG